MKVLHSKGAFEGREKRIFIAVPSYADVGCAVMYSMFGAKEAFLRSGIESELYIVTENCHVDDGRNYCVRAFLESNCTDLVFVDADIRFDPEDIVRLSSYGQDVVAGIYPKKQEQTEYPVQFIDGEIWSNSDGLIKVEGVPTGFLKISRKAIEALDGTVPHYVAQKEPHNRRKIPLIFERILHDHTRLGGDYEFCRKWRALGGEIFIDPEMSFGHIGPHEWTGTLGHYLRKSSGLTSNHIVSIIEKLKKKTDSAKDINSLWEAWDNPWTPDADMLSAINMIARDGTGPILECGSGLSTLILGASGRPVMSLEHDPAWHKSISQYLEMCDLSNAVVHRAPIKDKWYDIAFKSLLDAYSMVLVDGPPRGVGDRSLVVENIQVTDDCIFIVDDIGTDLDVCEKITEKFGVKFNYFGRYAIGRKNK